MTATGGGPALPGTDAAARDDGGSGVTAAHAPRLRTVLGLAKVEASLLARSLLVLAGLLAGGVVVWVFIYRAEPLWWNAGWKIGFGQLVLGMAVLVAAQLAAGRALRDVSPGLGCGHLAGPVGDHTGSARRTARPAGRIPARRRARGGTGRPCRLGRDRGARGDRPSRPGTGRAGGGRHHRRGGDLLRGGPATAAHPDRRPEPPGKRGRRPGLGAALHDCQPGPVLPLPRLRPPAAIAGGAGPRGAHAAVGPARPAADGQAGRGAVPPRSDPHAWPPEPGGVSVDLAGAACAGQHHRRPGIDDIPAGRGLARRWRQAGRRKFRPGPGHRPWAVRIPPQ